MDATITVDGVTNDKWIKPGAESTMVWKGYEWNHEWVDPIPTSEELKAAFQLMQAGTLAPVLEEVITHSLRRITEQRRGS